MISVIIDSIRIDTKNQQQVVVLKDESGERFLPIWIEPFEADTIAIKLQGISTPRPLTHDLLCSVIEDLGAEVDSVVITELRNNTFYAEIILKLNGEDLKLDSRPSDALALAVRTQSPIFVEEAVLDNAGICLDKETGRPTPGSGHSGEVSQDDLRRMSAFTDYINTLDLDDINKVE